MGRPEWGDKIGQVRLHSTSLCGCKCFASMGFWVGAIATTTPTLKSTLRGILSHSLKSLRDI